MLALKPYLEQHNISQAWLAQAVGVSAALVSRYLNHAQEPKTIAINVFQDKIVRACWTQKVAVLDCHFKPVSTAPTAETDKQTADDTQQPLTQEVVDMLLRKQTLTPNARKQFGLFRDPFANDIESADDVFVTPDIRYVREYLWSTAKHGGFMAVCGESGAGKSTLRKDLEERINREDAPIVVMSPYVLGMEDNDIKGKTLKSASIADAMITTLAPLEKPRITMEAKGRQLHRLLKESRRAGFNHVLIIEEAHALSVPTLKHLKRFYELEDGFKKLLSIVLIGQSELKLKLGQHDPQVREVVQRCELIELPPLDADLENYLKFKFDRVGKKLDEVFSRDALDAIRGRLIFQRNDKERQTVSLMYPLMINNLVTGALNAAAGLGFEQIDGELIREL